VPLAALILATEDSEGSALPALLPIAGQALFAYQVRMAHAAGAAHIVALVDNLPSGMVSTLDTLREQGISVDIARDARDAADRVHPDEALLVMAEGLVTDRTTLDAVASSQKPVLLCVAPDRSGERFERIDANAKWSGLALLDGAILRETAAMVGEWKLGATLLRKAVQAGTAQRQVEAAALLLFPETVQEAESAGRELAMRASIGRKTGYVAKGYAWIVNKLSPLLPQWPLPLPMTAALPASLALLAVLLGLAGWHKSALMMFLISPIFAGLAEILSNITVRIQPALRWYRAMSLPVIFVLLALIGWEFSSFPDGWGPLALSFWAGSSVLLATNPVRTAKPWFPEGEGIAVILLLALLVGWPIAGIGLVLLHGLAAQLVRVRDA
jgi:hypothetical protein